IRRLAELRGLGCPILVGPSRKSFVGKVLNLPPDQRLEGTAAAVALSIANGAHMVRVHDVEEMRRVSQIADLIAGRMGYEA
ncbi:dihydropteroate synthase, partial [candidate division KSB1 bacterium]|nr:dihydropteroate synthase [candidate division KSB1 bacterium]